MVYDALEYGSQVNEVAKRHKEEKDYVDNYHLHLIIPSEIEDFNKFQTSIGEVLEFIKASKDEVMMDQIINSNPAYKQLDNEAVSMINVCTGIQIPVEKKEGKMNMCKAWNDHKMSGVIEGKNEGKEIVNRLILCLIRDGKQEEIEKVVSDSTYQEEMIQYYGLDKELENLEV